MRTTAPDAFPGCLEEADHLVELGIGARSDLAATLVRRGIAVTAVDIEDQPVPEGVQFVRDDLTDPTLSVYANADVLYAQRLPPDLHVVARELARQVDSDLVFTTLGFEEPAIPVERMSTPSETWFRAR